MVLDMASFTITRDFLASQSLTFDCWVLPDRFVRWFPPSNCTTTLLQANVEPGGLYLQEDRWPDGSHFCVKHVFREVKPKDRLVFVTSFCTKTGQVVKHPHAPLWPENLLTTVAFEEEGRNARVTVTWEPVDVSDEETVFFREHPDWCQAGWNGTFDRLASYLESFGQH
jgi:uncharacterized protein YndB with AHSA1/START domain